MIVVAPRRTLMDSELAEDLELARRVVNGDESAMDALYERWADPLYAFISHSLDGSRPDAEELRQDTLETGVRTLASYQEAQKRRRRVLV